MTTITLFTDPHLGVSRQAHTTKRSSEALQMSLYAQALAILHWSDNPKVCLGDLFDKAFNPERIIAQGINVAMGCEMTLSGNHDETNRDGTITSLQVVQEAGAPVCRAADMSMPYFSVLPEPMAGVYLVPHHASQVLFLEACKKAAQHAAQHREGLASFLFLHCNYNFGLAITDNTLNLPADFAEELLESFDRIFIGHEHNGATHHNGQVVIMGNTHPTSFSDISDKFIYHLDLETAEYSSELVWSEKEHYREIKLGGEIPDLTDVQFVDVSGLGTAATGHEVHAFIQDIWKAAEYNDDDGTVCSSLFAVRNNVVLKDSLQGIDTAAQEVKLEDLTTTIRRNLKGTEMEELFEELLVEVTL